LDSQGSAVIANGAHAATSIGSSAVEALSNRVAVTVLAAEGKAFINILATTEVLITSEDKSAGVARSASASALIDSRVIARRLIDSNTVERASIDGALIDISALRRESGVASNGSRTRITSGAIAAAGVGSNTVRASSVGIIVATLVAVGSTLINVSATTKVTSALEVD